MFAVPDMTTDSAHPLQQGARLAEDVRAAARSELGLVVSVGVAANKLLAKLASRVAKPDGVHVVDGQALGKMLAETPVERLPGESGGGDKGFVLAHNDPVSLCQCQW